MEACKQKIMSAS